MQPEACDLVIWILAECSFSNVVILFAQLIFFYIWGDLSDAAFYTSSSFAVDSLK
jgi:hypothetical protein